MRKVLDVSMRQAWGWGVLLVGAMASLSFAAVGAGALNGVRIREVAKLQAGLDSLRPRRETLERQARLLRAIERVVPGADPSAKAVVATEIDRNAELYGYDPLVLLAVVVTESGIDADAIGRKRSGAVSGAQGIMQIKPLTARAMAQALHMEPPDGDDLHDPAYNLRVGVAFLLMMIHQYQDLRLGIMAYNVGPGGLEQGLRGERSLPEGYYRKVMRVYRKLERAWDEEDT